MSEKLAAYLEKFGKDVSGVDAAAERSAGWAAWFSQSEEGFADDEVGFPGRPGGGAFMGNVL